MAAKTIDARGSHCPGPMMELIRAMRGAAVGEAVAVWTTDPGSKKDIPLWCQKAGQEFVGVTQCDGYEEILVRKVK
ncbi:MAG TPA: sulfurtransferase TusA family protein [Symbiobacteriaceae bacterium]|jgi:TusA-related sulfurtransferase|nr:sulfurtransferase TusA family protein [Symbiobacteriaceae bacterium]